MNPKSERAGKFNVCLEYHIKNCAVDRRLRFSLSDGAE